MNLGRWVALIMLAILLGVVVLPSSGVGMTALTAQSALPGDVLYAMKTGLEQSRTSLTAKHVEQVNLHLLYAQR